MTSSSIRARTALLVGAISSVGIAISLWVASGSRERNWTTTAIVAKPDRFADVRRVEASKVPLVQFSGMRASTRPAQSATDVAVPLAVLGGTHSLSATGGLSTRSTPSGTDVAVPLAVLGGIHSSNATGGLSTRLTQSAADGAIPLAAFSGTCPLNATGSLSTVGSNGALWLTDGRTASLNELEEVRRNLPPELEVKRQNDESKLVNAISDIEISSDFECSTPVVVERIGPTHFSVTVANPSGCWLMFRLDKVRSRTVRVDLKNLGMKDCGGLNPMYSYSVVGTSPAELMKGFENPLKMLREASNGARLPQPQADGWNYVDSVWCESDAPSGSSHGTLSFVKTYEQDAAYVAIRTPYPPSFCEQLLSGAVGSRGDIVKIGEADDGRALLLARIGVEKAAAEQAKKPCVLIYAGEHSDEYDSSWVALGAVYYLAGDSASARSLRDHVTFLVIPQLDPASSAKGLHGRVTGGFLSTTLTKESIAYANWFQRWVDAGNRLDIVLSLHNQGSAVAPHVGCRLSEGLGARGVATEQLNAALCSAFQADGFNTSKGKWERGWAPGRLGGWLDRRYGALTLVYEINSQFSAAHLNVAQLAKLGEIFAETSGDWVLRSEVKRGLLIDIDKLRCERIERWKNYVGQIDRENAINAEAAVSQGIGLPAKGVGRVEKWIN